MKWFRKHCSREIELNIHLNHFKAGRRGISKGESVKLLTHLRSRGEASRSPFVPVHDRPYLPSYHLRIP